MRRNPLAVGAISIVALAVLAFATLPERSPARPASSEPPEEIQAEIAVSEGLYASQPAPGLPIERKEWVFFVLSFIGIMLGTINIRMAEMRERNQQFLPLGDVDNEGRPARKK